MKVRIAWQGARGWQTRLSVAAGVTLALVLSGCASGETMPTTRTVVNAEGARLTPDAARMAGTSAWINAELENIDQDPSFMLIPTPEDTISYPWKSLEVIRNQAQDTVKIAFDRLGGDAITAYNLYAHMHLMAEVGRIGEFFPEAEGLQGFELERAILARVSEAWLYGRSVLSTIPHPVWDEIMYATESGFLEPMILVAQGDRFADERRSWEESNPQALTRYRDWFRATFDREPPGLRAGTADAG
jgi:hypothetical protein